MMEHLAASLIVPMAFSLIQPVASSLINEKTGKGQEGGFKNLSLIRIVFNDESSWEKSQKSRKKI